MKTLKDIGTETGNAKLGTGTTKVWYTKSGFEGLTGFAWAVEKGAIVAAATLAETHTCLGTVDVSDPEGVWMMMQGENWSPEGQARGLIGGLGLRHTSMDVGDIVELADGSLHMVAGCGFRALAA